MTDPRMNKGTGWEQDRKNADRRRYDASRQGTDMEDRREPEDMLNKVKQTYYDAKEKVAEKVHEGLDYISGENKRDEDVSKKMRRGYRDAKDTVSDKSEDMKNSMRRSYRDSKERISDESEDVADRVKDTYYNAKEKVADYVSGDRDYRPRAGRDLERATGMGTETTSREGNRLLEGDKPIDIVCVDGSVGADKAIKYAFKNLPKNHSFLLVHGIYSPITGRSSKDDDWESIRLEKKYRSICRETGRECAFMHFNFTSNNDFGDRVCRYARYNNVKSVVLGRREDVSDLRRTFLGSSSQAVLNHCSTPVTMVSDEGKESYIE